MGLINAIKKLDLSGNNKSKQQPYTRERAKTPPEMFNEAQLSKDDLFANPISTEEPPAIFKRSDHHQPPIGCKSIEPIQTNNFYNNLTLADQTFPVWTQPYSLWLTKDGGQDAGMAFNHTEASQRVFGPEPNANPVQYYFNPPKIKSFVFSGEGLNENNITLNLENHQKMSVTAIIGSNNSSNIVMPLVQGMGFVSAIYKDIKPVISSQVGVHHFDKVGNVGSITKYKVELFNQVVWSMYVSGDVEFKLSDGKLIGSNKCNNVLVQIARGENKVYDESAGSYPESCTLTAKVSSADGKKCQYGFKFNVAGKSKVGRQLFGAYLIIKRF